MLFSIVLFLMFFSIEGIKPVDGLIVICSIAYARQIARTAVDIVRHTPLFALIWFIFFIFYGLSVLVGGLNLSFIVNFALNVIMSLLIISAIRYRVNLSYDIFILSAGYFASAVIATLQLISLVPNFPGQFEVMRDGRFMGLYGDPNILGAFSIFMIIYWFDRLFFEQKRPVIRSFIDIIFLLSSLLQLIYSQSRSSWLGFAISAMVYLVITGINYKSKIVVRVMIALLSIGPIAAVALSVTETGSVIMERIDSFTASSDAEEERFEFYYTRIAIEAAKDHPLGVGPGMASATTGLMSQDGDPIGSHNAYVHVFFENGWVSGACFSMIVLSILVDSVRRSLASRDNILYAYSSFASALVGQVFCGMFQDLIQWKLMWLVPSIFLAATLLQRDRGVLHAHLPSRRRPLTCRGFRKA